MHVVGFFLGGGSGAIASRGRARGCASHKLRSTSTVHTASDAGHLACVSHALAELQAVPRILVRVSLTLTLTLSQKQNVL